MKKIKIVFLLCCMFVTAGMVFHTNQKKEVVPTLSYVSWGTTGQLVRDVHHLLPLCNLLEPLIELVFRPRSPLLKATHSPAARRKRANNPGTPPRSIRTEKQRDIEKAGLHQPSHRNLPFHAIDDRLR